MRVLAALLGVVVAAGVSEAQTLNCDLQDYKSVDGVKAEMSRGSVG